MAGAQSRRAKAERHVASSSSTTKSSHSVLPSDSPSHSGKSDSPPVGGHYDGNADPAPSSTQFTRNPLNPEAEITSAMRNMDLGAAAFNMVRGQTSALSKRPDKPSTLGREVLVGLNTFPVALKPGMKITQYQVLVGTGAEKRGLIKKAWASNAVQSELPVQKSWIFDGNSLAWSLQELREIRVQVDLDAEQGKPPRRDGKLNTHRVVIKKTGQIDFASLTAYLARGADFSNKCLEAVTFLDHLMREGPSQRFTQIKRSFFAKGQKRFELGGGIEAFKGVYQSLRIAHSSAGAQLTVNVDVANGTFFTGGEMWTVLVRMLNLRGPAEIGLLLKDDNMQKRKFNETRRLRKLHVHSVHRGKGTRDDYVIDRFLNQSSSQYKIDLKEDGVVKSRVSIEQYMRDKYKLRLAHPDWPVVMMTRKAVLPLELLWLEENQRYPFKLDDRQTASMIKVAVTPPKDRWADIEHGLGMVGWAEDPYLKEYGMKISPQQTIVKGRLLDNPSVQFDKSATDPRTSGRWDLKGKKFLEPNPAPLRSWGFCMVASRFPPKKEDVERFINSFIAAYKAHGGRVEKSPCLITSSGLDPGKCVEELWNTTGNTFQARPQILCFILPDKDSMVYGRIKRSCECRYGVVSQCMQMAHVQKCQPQYMSNVLMKLNAKLGGVTSRAVGKTSKGPKGLFAKHTTCIIGVDVSHAAPGSQVASMAAVTCSTNKLATRYAANCEVNGYRKEMIEPDNISKLIMPLIKEWVQTVNEGRFPDTIIYFRDGVSEGQFTQVMEQEVQVIQQRLRAVKPDHPTKFVVIVASKRHHVRFFPKPGTGDRNGNPLPGTLVETGVTHPRENDFYLCSHAAIKGTARPVHYHILLNERDTENERDPAKRVSNEEFQTLIYEHCYQYIRATTPVSLFPAVYYAHLASNRALHHDKNFGGANSHEKALAAKQKQQQQERQSGGDTIATSDMEPLYELLMPMPNTAQIAKGMWYI
ncbi:hypothetical protein AAFC00_006700 [Neodothiora populina]|uniref:Uncharacterized protein n=1 Tax=Neodothiora populina TaxID=2781224 RepID=A0ABR3PB12_9PEZI